MGSTLDCPIKATLDGTTTPSNNIQGKAGAAGFAISSTQGSCTISATHSKGYVLHYNINLANEGIASYNPAQSTCTLNGGTCPAGLASPNVSGKISAGVNVNLPAL